MTCCKQSWKAIGALIIVAYCQAIEQDIGQECTNENGVTGFCQFKNKCSKETDLGVICNSEESIICCAKNVSKIKHNLSSNNDKNENQSVQSRFGFFPDFFHAPEPSQNPISNINFFNYQKPRNPNLLGNVLHQNLNIKEFIEDRPYESFEQDVVTKPNKKKNIPSTRPTNENNFYSTNNNQNSNIDNIFESDQTRKPQSNYNNPIYETNRPNWNQNINNNRPYYETNTANQNSYNNNNNNNNHANSVSQRPSQHQNTYNNQPYYETSNTENQNSYNKNNYESLESQRPNQNQNIQNNQPNYETNTANQNYNNDYLPSSVTPRPNQNSNKQPSSVSSRPNRYQNNNSNRPNQGTHQLNQNNNFNENPSYYNPSTQKPQKNYNSGNYETNSQQPNSHINSNGFTNHHATSSSILFPDDSTNNKYQTQFTSTTKKYYEHQNGPHENSKRISEMKCEEYSRPLTTTISAIPLSIDTSPKPLSIEKCDSKSVGLIVGGAKAELGEFPHMVAIGFRVVSGNPWNCGGTLISEQYVLTAAHCTHSVLGEPVQIRLGELNLKNNNDGANAIDLSVDEIIVHPDYVSTSKYNDIALIRLNRPVKFNDHIRPACLHNNNNIYSRKVTATGWGSIAYGDRSSDDLLKVNLDVIDNQQCNKLYEAESKTSTLNRGIINSMMCAGDLEGGHDTCLGDSGGPLVIRSEKNSCIFTLIGITSFGKFCATENSPGVYTRISTFLPWIEQIVWP